jgi:predicted nucleic acid-binding protein
VTVRTVVDNNVVVSGILSPGGKPAATLRAAGVAFPLGWTPGIVAERLRVLAYPRIEKVLAPTQQEYALRVVAGLAAGADMVSPELLPKLHAAKADPVGMP